MLFLLTRLGNGSFNITKSDSLIRPENAGDRQVMSAINIRSYSSSSKDGKGKRASDTREICRRPLCRWRNTETFKNDLHVIKQVAGEKRRNGEPKDL